MKREAQKSREKQRKTQEIEMLNWIHGPKASPLALVAELRSATEASQEHVPRTVRRVGHLLVSNGRSSKSRTSWNH